MHVRVISIKFLQICIILTDSEAFKASSNALMMNVIGTLVEQIKNVFQ